MPTIASHHFYVYILCRPNGKPFYVGKGQGKRVFRHESEARSGHVCHKCSIIRKILKSGGEIQRYIIFTTNDEQEAHAYEVETIALYGRKNLANQTDGGDGTSGHVFSDEARAKQSIRQKALAATPEGRLRVKAQTSKPSYRANLSAAMKARYADPEVRAATAAATKAHYANHPEARVELSNALRKRLDDPEQRAKLSAQSKARWADPESRAKQMAGLRAYLDLPATRQQRSENAKAAWARRRAKLDALSPMDEAEVTTP